MEGNDQPDDQIDEEIENIMFKAAIIAMIAGVIVAAYLIWLNSQESYSALYIYPESYSNYINKSELPKDVLFTYGIKSYETSDKIYHISIFLGNKLVKYKEVKIKRGETFEENESVTVYPNTTFPVKVKIVAEVNGVTYEVHFWLKEMPH
ncbi:MAG: hypothetical protein H0Z28_09555 [Archaeoglobus sp.]|nr:hypothetical protein [Archaeoglobus sp.]